MISTFLPIDGSNKFKRTFFFSIKMTKNFFSSIFSRFSSPAKLKGHLPLPSPTNSRHCWVADVGDNDDNDDDDDVGDDDVADDDGDVGDDGDDVGDSDDDVGDDDGDVGDSDDDVGDR